MKTKNWSKVVKLGLLLIAAVYVLALVKIVLLKSGLSSEHRYLQLVPFTFIKDLQNPLLGLDVVLKNVLGNFAIFIPLGILLPSLLPKRLNFWTTVIIGFLTSLAFEAIQYIVGFGMTDVDDLILNTFGALTGAALYFGLFLRKGKELRAICVSFIFLAVFGCLGVLSLWLYNPSTLPAQIEIINEAALGGTYRESYHVSASCEKLEDSVLILREGSIFPVAKTTAIVESYTLTSDTLIVFQRISAKYSPNGNVQKTIVTYESADETALAAEIDKNDGGFVDLWTADDASCTMLVYVIYERQE